MSKLGMRVSWAIIIASSLFIAGYLLRYGRQAEGRPGASVPAASSQPSAGQTMPQAEPSRASLSTEQHAGPPAGPVTPPHPATGHTAGRPSAPQTPVSGDTGRPLSTQPTSAERSRLPPLPQPEANAPPPEEAPRIQMQEVTFDFGEVYQLEEVTHEFAFANTGKSTLTIGAITASCGCAVVTPSKKDFAPGEQGTIKVVFNAARYRDRVSKHIYVDTNDPVTPRVILTMTGVVKVEVEVTPTGIYTGRLKVGDSIERIVTITPVEVKSFNILGVKSDHPALTAEAQAAPDKPGAYQIKVRFGPVAKPERINAKVVIRTDLPHTKELSISVFGRVQEEEATDVPPAK